MRRIAVLAALTFVGAIATVNAASSAMAVPPPNPLIVTSPSNNQHVPYGTSSLDYAGSGKDPMTAVLINGASCDNSVAFFNSSGNWSCSRGLIPAVADFDIEVSPANGDGTGPATPLHFIVDPSVFSVGTPSAVGSTVTVSGAYDTADPLTDVEATLKRTGDPDVGPLSCDLNAGSYSCSFLGVIDNSGYTVEVSQFIEDSDIQTTTSSPFVVGPVSPPNPPGNPKPPNNPKPANPTIAPLLGAPLVATTTPTPNTGPTPSATPTPGTTPTKSPNKKPHDKAFDATNLLNFGIAGVVLLALGGGRGISRSEAVIFAWRDDGEVKRKVDLTEKVGPGDRSFTWRFPWHTPLDAASLVAPGKLAPRSPFLGRLAADGGEFRAMFGTLWLLLPGAGAVLGAVAVADTSGHAVPPAYWLVAGITVLAIFEALAGAIATVVFFGGVLLSGGFWNEAEPDFAHSVLVFLILSLLWTALPLIGTAARPFRRLGRPSARYAWDRVADLIIASLLCAWIAQKSLEVSDLFAGTETGLEDHADQLAIIVLIMIVVRIVIEHLASIWYPKRLTEVETDGELPRPTRAANLVGITVRTAAYSFIGHVFIGTCWQWWLGTALFFVPQVGALVQHRFRAVELFKRLVPKGLVEVFVLIVACTLAVRYAEHNVEPELEAIRWAFLALAVPPALIGSVALFGGEAERGKRTWVREMVGLVILVVTVALALQGWEY